VSAGVAIRLEHLRRTFGAAVAVEDLVLDIGDREFFSLIGPSGCGKTTTLRMIAGLETPTAGTVTLHGRDVTRIPPHRRPVSTVFQHYALFPHLTVGENVAFGLRERKVARAELRSRVAEMLELVGLTGRESARPRELSGGQQQRVALARSLVLRPEVLLLDEPLGALDLKLRKQMQLLLKRLQREVAITFVYVTHDQEEAFFMSDRVAIMNDGRLEQVGVPGDVYRRPASVFVADFVGVANQLPGTVRAVHGDGSYDVGLAGIERARVDGVAGLGVGDEVVAIVRPEALRPGPPADGELSLVGSVRDAANLGPQTSYIVDGPGGLQLSVMVASGPNGLAAAIGEEGRFSWGPAATWVLPAGPASAPPGP
jgi:spermidine/putrescine transport system ATP-binding protein